MIPENDPQGTSPNINAIITSVRVWVQYFNVISYLPEIKRTNISIDHTFMLDFIYSKEN